MQAVPILQVDAFTTKPFAGSACAVVLDADGLTDAVMQTIAAEVGLAKTVFVTDSDVADVRARSFAPGEEIPFAGYPEVALAHTLLVKGRLPRGESTVRRLSIETDQGFAELDVSGGNGAPPLISFTLPAPDFFDEHDREEVAAAFNLAAEDLVAGLPVQTVSTGIPHLMVPVASSEALQRVRVQPERYAAMRRFGGFVGAHLFVREGASERGDVFARHFDPPYQGPERSFLGLANGAMAAYLWYHQQLEQPRFTAEQGHWLGRPGEAEVEVLGEPHAIRGVRLTGHAVQVMEGLMLVPDD